MVKIRWIVLAGILTYVVFLVVSFPAHFLLEQFPQMKHLGPVSIHSATGTIWNGRANAKVNVQGARFDMNLDWRLLPSYLLRGRVGLDLAADSVGLDLQGIASVSSSIAEIDEFSGTVKASFINRIAKVHRAEISGDVSVNQLSILLDHKEKLAKEASGTIAWPGGDVVGGGQSFNAPALVGTLSMEDEVLKFELTDQQLNNLYADADYLPTGWARVSVKKLIMELAGEKVSKRKAAQSAFEVKQKLF